MSKRFFNLADSVSAELSMPPDDTDLHEALTQLFNADDDEEFEEFEDARETSVEEAKALRVAILNYDKALAKLTRAWEKQRRVYAETLGAASDATGDHFAL